MIRRVISLVLAATLMLQVARADGSEPDTTAANDSQDVLYLAGECPIFIRLHVQVDGESYLSAWKKHFDKYFDKLDKSDDGILSAAEARSLPKPTLDKKTNTSVVDKANSFFQSLGGTSAAKTAGNNDMTQAEVESYLDEIGQGAFSMKSVRRTSAFAGMGTSQPGPDSIDLFSRLDDDQNGKLSHEELRSSSTTLHKLDLDDDEMISAEELQPNPYASFVPTQNKQIPSAKSPFIRLRFRDGSEEAVELAGKLLQNYDRLNSETRKKDGRLTRHELNLTQTTFDGFDDNADEYLTEDELEKLLLEPVPTLQVAVRIGKRNGTKTPLTVVSDNSTDAVAIRQTNDGSPTIVLEREQIEFVTEGTSSGTEGLKPIVRAQFAGADTDNNGYLDQKEVGRNPALTAVFGQADTDGDKKVFQKELLTFLDEQYAASQSRTVLNVLGPNRNLFEIFDTSGDRRLSRRELASGVEQFDAWDRNADKELTSSEVPRQYRLSLGRATPDIGMLSAIVAAQNIYSPAQQVKSITAGPPWFQKMDRNRDGDVSEREFLFEASLFQKLDIDKNRLIEPSEAVLSSADQND